MSTPDMSTFAKYIPGFEFLQNLTKQAAGSAGPGMQSSIPGMPSLSHWVAPTFDVEELDKRIQDLKAVHFWLDQNTKALSATIQALEVQKMTLSTLKNMNVSMHEVAEAFKIKPEAFVAAAQASAETASKATSQAAPEPDAEASADAAPAVDPMQWWGALTQQFQVIATDVIRDMTDQAAKATEQMAEQMAQTVQAGTEAANQMAAAAEASPAATPASKVEPKAGQASTSSASQNTAPKAAKGAGKSVGAGAAKPVAAPARPAARKAPVRKTTVAAPARKSGVARPKAG